MNLNNLTSCRKDLAILINGTFFNIINKIKSIQYFIIFTREAKEEGLTLLTFTSIFKNIFNILRNFLRLKTKIVRSSLKRFQKV